MGLQGNGLVYSIDLFAQGMSYHDCENSIEVSLKAGRGWE